MTDSPWTTESSLLLIALAAALAVLTAHVALGWLHEAQRRSGWLGARGVALALSAGALGSGLCAASVLVLAGEALSFPIGYKASDALGLWLGAIAFSGVIGLLLVHSSRWWALTIGGASLGGMAMAVHAGWVQAAGFRPGVTWEPLFIAAAGVLLMVGCCSGLWLAWSESGRAQPGRGVWRLGASVLVGLSVVTGLEVLNSGLALPSQVGSVYSRQLGSGLVSMLGGVLLPLVLSVMAIDLTARRRQRRQTRRQTIAFPPHKGRRRKHKIPTL